MGGCSFGFRVCFSFPGFLGDGEAHDKVLFVGRIIKGKKDFSGRLHHARSSESLCEPAS